MKCSFCGNICIRNYDSAFEDTGTGIWWECIECGSMFEGGKIEADARELRESNTLASNFTAMLNRAFQSNEPFEDEEYDEEENDDGETDTDNL